MPTDPAPSLRTSRPHFLRRLYDWVLSWADSRWGIWALAALSFAESSFFPVPPDVLQIALSLGRPSRSFFYAAVSTAASVLGGLAGYGIGAGLWHLTSGFFFAYVFSPESFQSVSDIYAKYDVWFVFLAAFTPIPYKVFTIAAGVCSIHLPSFVVASVLGRGARFFLVGGLLYFAGPRMKDWIDRYFNLATLVFGILLLLGFLAIQWLA